MTVNAKLDPPFWVVVEVGTVKYWDPVLITSIEVTFPVVSTFADSSAVIPFGPVGSPSTIVGGFVES